MISLFLSRGRGKWEEFLFLFFGREFHSIPCDWSLKEGWWESSANKGKSYSRERARRRLKLLRFRVEIQRVAKSWLQTWRSGTWARQAVQRGRCAHGKGRERKRRVGRKKGGQLLLSLQDQLKYPDGWLEKSGGREYEASQQKIK